MAEIRTVFAWMGGVLSETIPEAVARVVYSKPLEEIGFDARQQIKQWADELSLGRISGTRFAQHIIDLSQAKIEPERVQTAITGSLEFHDDAADVLKELASPVSVWIISDYPSDWHCQIYDRFHLSRYIPRDRVILTANCQLERMVPAVFFAILRASRSTIATSLMIDKKSSRAVEAVRHGLSSAVYVDAVRLRREFFLRRMLPAPAGFIHPTDRT
jgi:FMN phosphatase YigB (HAD superfamily)